MVLAKNMKLTLSDGRQVQLVAFHTDRTYSGLLLGSPTPAINKRIIEEVYSRIQRLWHEGRPVHLMPPVTVKDRLPPLVNIAWLESEPMNEGFFGSYLIVAWFTPVQWERPIHTIVNEAIKDLDWNRLAVDYDP